MASVIIYYVPYLACLSLPSDQAAIVQVFWLRACYLLLSRQFTFLLLEDSPRDFDRI